MRKKKLLDLFAGILVYLVLKFIPVILSGYFFLESLKIVIFMFNSHSFSYFNAFVSFVLFFISVNFFVIALSFEENILPKIVNDNKKRRKK